MDKQDALPCGGMDVPSRNREPRMDEARAAANVEFAGKHTMNQDANPGLPQRGARSTGARGPKLLQLWPAGLLLAALAPNDAWITSLAADPNAEGDGSATWKRFNDDAHQCGGIGAIAADQNTYGRLDVAGNGRGLSYSN
ncbi:MAG: hypothetical protein ACJ8IK_02085 [Burkholderiaceae bacterium]